MNRPRALTVNARLGPGVAAQQFVADFGADLEMSRTDGRVRATRAGSAEATASARTVASITPPARPRQPACAAATASPDSAANSTGRQSAVRIAQMRPARRVTAPSAAGMADAPAASRSATCAAVHLREPARLRRKPAATRKPTAILRDRLRPIPDVIAEIQGRIRSGAHAAAAQRRQRAHHGAAPAIAV